MKYLLALCFCLPSFAQVTFSVQITGEPAVSITESAEALAAGVNGLLANTVIVPAATLTASATSSQTTFTVSSTTGLTTCMGIVTGSEVSLITGISGSVLTVTRHTLGTSAAAYSSGQAISFIQAGSGTCFLAQSYQIAVQAYMLNTPGPAISAAKSTITSAVASGVSHTP